MGDLAGFAAASLLRGVDFVQIPTSSAQVDSSVGGKTGVNAVAGKNLISAFYQPRAVLADIDLLTTLPRRELVAGAEVAKYGLLGDAGFFNWLIQWWFGAGFGLRCGDACGFQSCQARHGSSRQRTGEGTARLAEFGHAIAHAFEAVARYDGQLLHGEAVAAGSASPLTCQLILACVRRLTATFATHICVATACRLVNLPAGRPDRPHAA